MKYKAINQLEQFQFSDASILDIDYHLTTLAFQLANVTIPASNPNNRDIRDMRTNDLILTFEGATIVNFVEEGYKLYDADNNLTDSVPDKSLTTASYEDTLKSFLDAPIYSIEIKEDNICIINIDADMHTFFIEISYEKCIIEWDRFLQKE